MASPSSSGQSLSSTFPPTSISSTAISQTSSVTASVPSAIVTSSPASQPVNGTIATSASLYLYTFLATLVLLLSVSGAIVVRSFILRRRHRLMVEEAIRNGTWVPPTPPTRPPKVDLTKKPVLWEAYIDGKGDLIGHAAGGGADEGRKINDVWRIENAKDWDMIKPFAAAYLAPNGATTPMTTAPGLPGTPMMTGLATVPSIASLRSTTAPQPLNTVGPQADVEAANGPSNAATQPTSTRSPRHRALLSRALNVLNPTPNPTSPLPAPSGSNAGSNPNLPGLNGNAEMEQKGPQVMRVAVLIAMPSPPPGVIPGSGSGILSASVVSSSSLSSASSSTSPGNPKPAQLPPVPRPVHQPHLSTLDDDDDEQLLPHLEVGVAEVLVVPSDSGADSAHSSSGLSGKKKAAQRGSIGSVATGMSEGSDV